MEDATIMGRALPTHQNIAELQVELTDSENILREPTFAITVRHDRLSTHKSINMGTIKGTKAIAKVRSILWTLCNAKGYRVISGGLLDNILVEEEEGVEDSMKGSK